MRMVNLVGIVLLASALPALAQTAQDNLPSSDSLPDGTVKISDVVPGMGEHWGNPEDLPLGPIYCVHEGKVVCLEFMISQEDFAAGKSWMGLAGMEGLPPVNHVDIGFEPNGHEGYEIPHYDIHLYFITPEEAAAIK